MFFKFYAKRLNKISVASLKTTLNPCQIEFYYSKSSPIIICCSPFRIQVASGGNILPTQTLDIYF